MNRITPDDLENVLNSNALIDYVLDTFIMNTDSLEKLICILGYEKKSFDLNTILGDLNKMNIKINDPVQRCYAALKNLYDNNILSCSSDKYDFLYPLMPQIIHDRFAKLNIEK